MQKSTVCKFHVLNIGSNVWTALWRRFIPTFSSQGKCCFVLHIGSLASLTGNRDVKFGSKLSIAGSVEDTPNFILNGFKAPLLQRVLSPVIIFGLPFFRAEVPSKLSWRLNIHEQQGSH
jgi:hypothetical protein